MKNSFTGKQVWGTTLIGKLGIGDELPLPDFSLNATTEGCVLLLAHLIELFDLGRQSPATG